MKVLIDISYETYVRARRNSAYGIATDAEEAVVNGKVLDNMTNGKVIKAMFPDVIISESEDTLHLKYPTVNSDPLFFVQVSKDWWNEKRRK